MCLLPEHDALEVREICLLSGEPQEYRSEYNSIDYHRMDRVRCRLPVTPVQKDDKDESKERAQMDLVN